MLHDLGVACSPQGDRCAAAGLRLRSECLRSLLNGKFPPRHAGGYFMGESSLRGLACQLCVCAMRHSGGPAGGRIWRAVFRSGELSEVLLQKLLSDSYLAVKSTQTGSNGSNGVKENSSCGAGLQPGARRHIVTS